MRKVLILSACLFSTATFAEDATPATPPDVTLTMTAAEQQTWAQVGPVLDACIGAAVMRNDASSCAAVSKFLAAFAAKVAAAQPVK